MRPFCPELDHSVHLITLKTGSLLHSVLLSWQQRNLNAHIHSLYTFKFSRMVSQTTGNSEVCPNLFAIGSEHDKVELSYPGAGTTLFLWWWSGPEFFSQMKVCPVPKALGQGAPQSLIHTPPEELIFRPLIGHLLYATPSPKFFTFKSGGRYCCFSSSVAGELKHEAVKWFAQGHTAGNW